MGVGRGGENEAIIRDVHEHSYIYRKENRNVNKDQIEGNGRMRS